MNDPSLQSSLHRFGRWGRTNAQFMAVIIPTSAAVIGITYAVASKITGLQKDIELAKKDVDKAFAEGKAFCSQQFLNESHYITQLAFGEEYRNSREEQRNKRSESSKEK